MSITSTFRRYRATIVAGLVVAAVLVAMLVLVGLPSAQSEQGLVARVHAGDSTTRDLPLGQDGTFEFQTDLGRNVVVVQDGSARMADADCAHGDCMRQAAISSPGQQLICLPHQLWVEVVEANGDSGEMDVTAVTPASGDVDVVSR